MSAPIRIGETLFRTYFFYNPKAQNEWADPLVPEPDTNSPIDLTGITVTWNLKINSALHSFGTSSGVSVTPLTGRVDIEIEAEDTVLFKKNLKAESYMQFDYAGGNVVTRAHRIEQVVYKEDVV